MDAALPASVKGRVPDWAQTPRGRLLLSALTLTTLLGWLLVLLLITL